MTPQEAKTLIKQHEDHTQNLATGQCFNWVCIGAKSFLDGYTKGVRDAAKKLQPYMKIMDLHGNRLMSLTEVEWELQSLLPSEGTDQEQKESGK